MSARLRRLVGQFAMLAFLSVCVLPPAAGAEIWWNDDAACGASELGPRHATPQIESPQAQTGDTHCTICHWIRAVSGANALTGATLCVVLSPQATSGSAPVARYAHSSLDLQALRAPPVSSSL